MTEGRLKTIDFIQSRFVREKRRRNREIHRKRLHNCTGLIVVFGHVRKKRLHRQIQTMRKTQLNYACKSFSPIVFNIGVILTCAKITPQITVTPTAACFIRAF